MTKKKGTKGHKSSKNVVGAAKKKKNKRPHPKPVLSVEQPVVQPESPAVELRHEPVTVTPQNDVQSVQDCCGAGCAAICQSECDCKSNGHCSVCPPGCCEPAAEPTAAPAEQAQCQSGGDEVSLMDKAVAWFKRLFE